jgi:hypothetical protein
MDDDDLESRPRILRRRTFRGDTFVLDTQVLRPPPGSLPGSPPVPTNITGWMVWFTVKRTFEPDQFAVCQLTTTPTGQGGIAFTQPLIGWMEVTMNPIVTRGFPDGNVALPYDIQVRDLSGNLFTVEKGVIVVMPDVTEAIS